MDSPTHPPPLIHQTNMNLASSMNLNLNPNLSISNMSTTPHLHPLHPLHPTTTAPIHLPNATPRTNTRPPKSVFHHQYDLDVMNGMDEYDDEDDDDLGYFF